LNDVINKTASEVVDSHIFDNAAKILNTLVNTSFDAASKALVKVRDVTKADPPVSPSP
jgi:predicted negative regulator of RcsB-dependent stress response